MAKTYFKIMVLTLCFGFLHSSNLLNAESSLPLAKIQLANKVLVVEVAETQNTRATGLMFRKSMPSDHGMLFIFQQSEILTFWMRNTRIPLSIGFFDEKMKLINVLDMQPASDMDLNPPKYSSSRAAKYALEVNIGWYKRNNIKIGEQLKILEKH
jgi:uncharacterized protein